MRKVTMTMIRFMLGNPLNNESSGSAESTPLDVPCCFEWSKFLSKLMSRTTLDDFVLQNLNPFEVKPFYVLSCSSDSAPASEDIFTISFLN